MPIQREGLGAVAANISDSCKLRLLNQFPSSVFLISVRCVVTGKLSTILTCLLPAGCLFLRPSNHRVSPVRRHTPRALAHPHLSSGWPRRSCRYFGRVPCAAGGPCGAWGRAPAVPALRVARTVGRTVRAADRRAERLVRQWLAREVSRPRRCSQPAGLRCCHRQAADRTRTCPRRTVGGDGAGCGRWGLCEEARHREFLLRQLLFNADYRAYPVIVCVY